jgi:hypothetical protein
MGTNGQTTFCLLEFEVKFDAKNGMGTNGQTTFCLLEFEVKFETKNGAIFMFRVDKNFHCTMKNQGRNQYNMAFFQKNYVLNHLKSDGDH